MQEKYIILIICLLAQLSVINSELAAQSDSISHVVMYTTEFKFKEGFYLNFEQARNNKPIPKSRILTSIDYKSKTFFDQVTEAQTITYFDDLGNSQEIETNKFWGYCKNGILYIYIDGAFNRITIIGNICHFVAHITTYNNRYNGPYGYSPYGYGYYPYSYSPYGYGGYSSYGSPYGYGSPNYRTTEMKQFLIDFSTGKVLEYDNKSVEMLLMHDPELYDEYSRLRPKKKQQLRFMYVRKFNERNPLYVPK